MPLYCDDREPEEIVKFLKRYNLAIEVKHLGSGDYVFGEIAIERKTICDLVGSVTSGSRHFWDQLDTMKRTYTNPILFIEGKIDHHDRIVMGILTTVILFWKYQTVFTNDHKDTADWLAALFTKYGVGRTGRIPPTAVIRLDTPREIRWAMLQCIKGIGGVMAKRILEEIPYMFMVRQDDDPILDPKTTWNKKLSKIKGLNKKAKEMLVKVMTNE